MHVTTSVKHIYRESHLIYDEICAVLFISSYSSLQVNHYTSLHSTRFSNWWAVLDLNQRPKDYAYHFDFRRPFPVCGLDSILPFGLPVESLHVPQ
jgi:hypothetical protein